MTSEFRKVGVTLAPALFLTLTLTLLPAPALFLALIRFGCTLSIGISRSATGQSPFRHRRIELILRLSCGGAAVVLRWKALGRL